MYLTGCTLFTVSYCNICHNIFACNQFNPVNSDIWNNNQFIELLDKNIFDTSGLYGPYDIGEYGAHSQGH